MAMHMKSTTNIHNTRFFTEANLERMKDIMYDHHIDQGTYLYREGDAAKKLYFIQEGRVKLTKTTPEGKEFILHMFHSGDLLGQMDPNESSTHQFNAVAVESCKVGMIQLRDLEVLLWQFGDLAVEFMKWMGTTQRITETKFRDLILFGKPGALCSTLIRLVHTYGEDTPEGKRITRKLTHTDLAEMIGATRESVNRMINDLKQKDVLHMESGCIVVKDMDYLKDICHCENCPLDICRI
ncbi:Crp/Fnr family transcriptional regulator [Marinicrinis sediminis]|uniref:Crp/Fnr family transcriptional regulator n=1 Tax=Marinicrinis sediminis TaxID=1652465 RepID=A0ABW5R8D1_9BACL